jgi:aspartokinase-like uncharacterized kinase
LPKLQSKTRIGCFVLNGLFPERVEAVLEGRETVCSFIKCDLS